MSKIVIAVTGLALIYAPLAIMLGSLIGRRLKEESESESLPVIRPALRLVSSR